MAFVWVLDDYGEYLFKLQVKGAGVLVAEADEAFYVVAPPEGAAIQS